MAKILEDARRHKTERAAGYRERALAMFPHVCARCGREYSGKSLKELTVHHKDHNHDNNPPDGSNWELLCVYCHDAEHQDPVARDRRDRRPREGGSEPTLTHNPFEALKDLLGDTGESEEE